jgi:hypothetical protein
MSRLYNSYIEASGINKQTSKIVDEYSGDIKLYGGESEDDFVKRVSREIWESEGRFVPVMIELTYLEELPFERYELGEEEYNEYTRIKN